MHEWGDDWFEKYGDDLYSAIEFTENYLRKHHIGVYGKEKWGCWVDEYLHFWNGGIYEMFFGYRARIGTLNTYAYNVYKKGYKETKFKTFWNKKIAPKIVKLADSVHHFMYFKIDLGTIRQNKGESIEDFGKRYEHRLWKGLCYYSEKIGILKLVNDHQAKIYNKAVQLACKKWPMVQEEMVLDTCGYKMVKPCKWGDVDGEKIHNKYWKQI